MPPVRSAEEKNQKTGARRSARVDKKERAKKKEALRSQKSKRAEEIQSIQAKIDKTEKELRGVEDDDDQRNSLEALLSNLNADRETHERDLQKYNAQLDKIDEEDRMDIDEDQGENREDIPGDPENGAEESESSNSTEGQKVISDTGPNSATQSSERTASSPGPGENGLQESREQAEAPPTQETASDKSNDNAQVGGSDEHDQALSREEESSSPTPSDQNVRFRDPQEPGGNFTKPHSFIDCVPVASDSTTSNSYSKFSLENGTVIIQAQEGKLNLNKYGPNNSAIYIWSGTPATSRVEKMTQLHGSPHNLSMAWDDAKGVLKWKYKIAAIRSVAWKPKKVCDSMLSVLDSVEELNPTNKQLSSTYAYPFSCAFVDLVDGDNRLTACITRSDYKRLSKGGKESHAKIDRKFYIMACGQVERYRNWAGKDLDPKWNGQARIGRDDRDLTPMYKTPEPEMIQEPSTPEPSTPEPSTPQPSTPEPSTSEPSTSEPSTPETSASETSSAATSNRSETHNGMATEDDSQELVPISEFYVAFMDKKDIDPETPWKDLEDEIYAKFLAAARVYIIEMKKKKIKVTDDMGLKKALRLE